MLVEIAVADKVGTITLNRPKARNALSGEVTQLLDDAIVQLDTDPDVGAMILTGADPAFCAGFDLRALSTELRSVQQQRQQTPVKHLGMMPLHQTPIIGAINGAAVTGGLELAMGCDFLLASDRARFADTHARVGAMPGGGMTIPPSAHRHRPGPADDADRRFHRRRHGAGLGTGRRGRPARQPAGSASPSPRPSPPSRPRTSAKSARCTARSATWSARRPGWPSPASPGSGWRSDSTRVVWPPTRRHHRPRSIAECRGRERSGMKIYAGMDPRLSLGEVIAHARRVEALGYDGLHVAETVHDSLALALLALEHTERLLIRTSVALAHPEPHPDRLCRRGPGQIQRRALPAGTGHPDPPEHRGALRHAVQRRPAEPTPRLRRWRARRLRRLQRRHDLDHQG